MMKGTVEYEGERLHTGGNDGGLKRGHVYIRGGEGGGLKVGPKT
jgi:hypothetical protein